MRNKTLIVTAMTTLLLLGCSDDKEKSGKKGGAKEQKQAQQKASKADGAFTARDTDGNNRLSMDEVVKFTRDKVSKAFAKIDSNGDGMVAAREFAASKEGLKKRLKEKGLTDKEIAERLDKQFAALDEDADGKVSSKEFVTKAVQRERKSFKAKDANGDDQLNPKEFAAKAEGDDD